MRAKPVVCVIEDDAPVRQTICNHLHGAGLAAVGAPDGDVGVETVERENASVAIVDIFMPGKEGLETITELKAKFPLVKILAITGGGVSMPASETLSLADALGADDLLSKPFRRELLIKKVFALLGKAPDAAG